MSFFQRHTIIGVLVTMLTTSCQSTLFYTEYKSIDSHQWDRRDVKVFKLPVPEKDETLQLSVGMRTTEELEYTRLTVLATLFEEGKAIEKDTIEFCLFNENGASTGTGFPYIENTKEANHPITLKKGKKYKIKLTHIMRNNPVGNIFDVGISLDHKE